MKKFRVNLCNGEHIIVEAKNMYDAQVKARQEFGQLPNDVNRELVQEIFKDIKALNSYLIQFNQALKVQSKELDWTAVYKEILTCKNELSAHMDTISEISNSLLKVNKEELK